MSASRRLPSPASESGFISVGMVIMIALGILFLYLLLGAFKADPASYGTVPIPTKATPIELDGGDVQVSYLEDTPNNGQPLNPPADLTFSVSGKDGTAVPIELKSGQPEDSDAGYSRVIGTASVPEDGTYFVTAGGSDVEGPVPPQMAFGQSRVGAVVLRFNDVVDELKGPLGIVVLVVLGVLFLIPSFERAKDRRNAPPMH